MSVHVPQARVVRKGGILVVPPPLTLRQRLAQLEDALGPASRSFLAAVIGLWPLTSVLLLSLALVWLAAMQGSP
jgi:hypothetical protein